ncbi:MAG: hypothetical protein HKN21_07875, partial [Candidatus Eisenbacteria bacterium]|nr:hypothetical protein [Candidatus Eisenbacteria bacterium]
MGRAFRVEEGLFFGQHRPMARPPQMRPRFEIPVGNRGQLVFDRLREQLEATNNEFYGNVRSNFAFVRFSEEQRTLLSPHLELELRETDAGTMLLGRFSPRPNVWTGFMALFFVLGLVGLGGLIYGMAQLPLDGPIWTMWFAPISAALIAFI